MTRIERDKQYQFVKLCISLTKQGFHFNREKNNAYALIFDKVEARKLLSPYTKLPFVDGIVTTLIEKNIVSIDFKQWSDRTNISRRAEGGAGNLYDYIKR